MPKDITKRLGFSFEKEKMEKAVLEAQEAWEQGVSKEEIDIWVRANDIDTREDYISMKKDAIKYEIEERFWTPNDMAQYQLEQLVVPTHSYRQLLNHGNGLYLHIGDPDPHSLLGLTDENGNRKVTIQELIGLTMGERNADALLHDNMFAYLSFERFFDIMDNHDGTLVLTPKETIHIDDDYQQSMKGTATHHKTTSSKEEHDFGKALAENKKYDGPLLLFDAQLELDGNRILNHIGNEGSVYRGIIELKTNMGNAFSFHGSDWFYAMKRLFGAEESEADFWQNTSGMMTAALGGKLKEMQQDLNLLPEKDVMNETLQNIIFAVSDPGIIPISKAFKTVKYAEETLVSFIGREALQKHMKAGIEVFKDKKVLSRLSDTSKQTLSKLRTSPEGGKTASENLVAVPEYDALLINIKEIMGRKKEGQYKKLIRRSAEAFKSGDGTLLENKAKMDALDKLGMNLYNKHDRFFNNKEPMLSMAAYLTLKDAGRGEENLGASLGVNMALSAAFRVLSIASTQHYYTESILKKGADTHDTTLAMLSQTTKATIRQLNKVMGVEQRLSKFDSVRFNKAGKEISSTLEQIANTLNEITLYKDALRRLPATAVYAVKSKFGEKDSLNLEQTGEAIDYLERHKAEYEGISPDTVQKLTESIAAGEIDADQIRTILSEKRLKLEAETDTLAIKIDKLSDEMQAGTHAASSEAQETMVKKSTGDRQPEPANSHIFAVSADASPNDQMQEPTKGTKDETHVDVYPPAPEIDALAVKVKEVMAGEKKMDASVSSLRDEEIANKEEWHDNKKIDIVESMDSNDNSVTRPLPSDLPNLSDSDPKVDYYKELSQQLRELGVSFPEKIQLEIDNPFVHEDILDSISMDNAATKPSQFLESKDLLQYSIPEEMTKVAENIFRPTRSAEMVKEADSHHTLYIKNPKTGKVHKAGLEDLIHTYFDDRNAHFLLEHGHLKNLNFEKFFNITAHVDTGNILLEPKTHITIDPEKQLEKLGVPAYFLTKVPKSTYEFTPEKKYDGPLFLYESGLQVYRDPNLTNDPVSMSDLSTSREPYKALIDAISLGAEEHSGNIVLWLENKQGHVDKDSIARISKDVLAYKIKQQMVDLTYDMNNYNRGTVLRASAATANFFSDPMGLVLFKTLSVAEKLVSAATHTSRASVLAFEKSLSRLGTGTEANKAKEALTKVAELSLGKAHEILGHLIKGGRSYEKSVEKIRESVQKLTGFPKEKVDAYFSTKDLLFVAAYADMSAAARGEDQSYMGSIAQAVLLKSTFTMVSGMFLKTFPMEAFYKAHYNEQASQKIDTALTKIVDVLNEFIKFRDFKEDLFRLTKTKLTMKALEEEYGLPSSKVEEIQSCLKEIQRVVVMEMLRDEIKPFSLMNINMDNLALKKAYTEALNKNDFAGFVKKREDVVVQVILGEKSLDDQSVRELDIREEMIDHILENMHMSKTELRELLTTVPSDMSKLEEAKETSIQIDTSNFNARDRKDFEEKTTELSKDGKLDEKDKLILKEMADELSVRIDAAGLTDTQLDSVFMKLSIAASDVDGLTDNELREIKKYGDRIGSCDTDQDQQEM